jgi:hypothetical protein
VDISDIGRIAHHVKDGEGRKEGKDGKRTFLISIGSHSTSWREKDGNQERMEIGLF